MAATITPGPTHGKDLRIFMDGLDISGRARDCTVSAVSTSADITGGGGAAGFNWREFLSGLRGWSASIDAIFTAAAADSIDEVLNKQVGLDAIGVWMFGFHGDELGRRALYAESAVLDSAGPQAPLEDVVTLNAALQGHGQVEGGQIHQVKETVSSFPSSPASIDFGSVSTLLGGAGFLFVFDITGGTSITCKIRDSADDAVFADLVDFTVMAQANAPDSEVVRLGAADTVRRYTQFEVTEIGGVTSATVAAGFVRNLTDQS